MSRSILERVLLSYIQLRDLETDPNYREKFNARIDDIGDLLDNDYANENDLAEMLAGHTTEIDADLVPALQAMVIASFEERYEEGKKILAKLQKYIPYNGFKTPDNENLSEIPQNYFKQPSNDYRNHMLRAQLFEAHANQARNTDSYLNFRGQLNDLKKALEIAEQKDARLRQDLADKLVNSKRRAQAQIIHRPIEIKEELHKKDTDDLTLSKTQLREQIIKCYTIVAKTCIESAENERSSYAKKKLKMKSMDMLEKITTLSNHPDFSILELELELREAKNLFANTPPPSPSSRQPQKFFQNVSSNQVSIEAEKLKKEQLEKEKLQREMIEKTKEQIYLLKNLYSTAESLYDDLSPIEWDAEEKVDEYNFVVYSQKKDDLLTKLKLPTLDEYSINELVSTIPYWENLISKLLTIKLDRTTNELINLYDKACTLYALLAISPSETALRNDNLNLYKEHKDLKNTLEQTKTLDIDSLDKLEMDCLMMSGKISTLELELDLANKASGPQLFSHRTRTQSVLTSSAVSPTNTAAPSRGRAQTSA